MNVAARFPIKNDQYLYWFLVVVHLIAASISLLLLSSIWGNILVLIAIVISFYFSRKQFVKLCEAEDDLCWSGENWLMHRSNDSSIVDYLDIQPTCWVTASFCLLKFEVNQQEKAWFFSKKSLGGRLYRELCYLVIQDMKKTNS